MSKIAALLILAGMAFGADSDAPAALSPDVQAAVDKDINQSLSPAFKAYSAYQAALAKAQDKVVKDLEKMKVDATKKGDLDTANALVAKIAEIKSGSLAGC
jgi:hypothetical protein